MRLQRGKNKFNFTEICPSDLGNRHINPRGWRWMSVTLLLICLGYFALQIAIFFRIEPMFPITSWIITILVVFGCIGGFVSAIVPEDQLFKVHFISGTFYIVGFSLAFLFSMGFITIQIFTKQSWPPLGLALVLFLPMFILTIYLLGRLAVKKGKFKDLFAEEWIIFFLILFWNFAWSLLIEFLPT
jgi:hypothetical protein